MRRARSLLSLLRWLIPVFAFPGPLTPSAPAQAVLSEFVASNSRGLRDDDGDAEDWIEIHNPGRTPVHLAGWSLTDSPAIGEGWEFPALTLAPGGFLVVFASGKDRRDPARPLHTDFRLAADGEYLALLRPDGSVATAFAPAYPPQAEDTSFGYATTAAPVTLLSSNATGRLWIPMDDALGTAWTEPDFDATAWDTVTLGIGWDDTGLTPAGLIRTDIADRMRGRNAAAYLRLPFVVERPDDLDALELRVRVDDGFACALNGEFILQRNAPLEAAGGVVADQVDDWSAQGEQGVKGWYYGWYDRAADADLQYDPHTDFETLDPLWTWNGQGWALGPGNPPWTSIERETWHPNGNAGGASVQWAIRRWVSQTAGSATLQVAGAKQNTGCGNGVTFRVLHNGQPRFSRTIAHDDSTGFVASLDIDDLDFGDYLDFVLDPTGTDGDTADGCDGSTFALQILQAPSAGLTWNSTALKPRTEPGGGPLQSFDLSAARDRLRAGTNLLAVQLLNTSPSDADLLLDAELLGETAAFQPGAPLYFPTPTPGQFNGAGGLETLGPAILSVSATPPVPADADALVVAAQVRPTLRTVDSVHLRYRVMFGSETPVAMRDDGRDGDAVAGDGWWTALIPASASAPGQMVRWSVTAADTGGSTRRSPPYPDPRRSPQYHGTVIADPSLASSRLPILHWYAQNPAGADTDTGTRGALFFEGEFYDNISANLHGQSTRGFPKKSYDFDFHPGHNFRWRRDQPRVDDFNLLTTWADKSHLRNVLAYETYAQAGVPAHFAFPVRVQLNGRFHAVANLVENGDDRFLERLGLDPNGALYKMYNSAESVSQAEKKTRKNEGTQDLADLIRGFTTGTTPTREAFLFDNLDVPEVINYLATRALTADADCCHKNYYLYRDTLGSGEWSAFPWDVDLSFGRVWTCGSPCLAYYDETLYTNTGLFVGENNRVFSFVLNQPATRQMYLRRLRTLMDALTQPPEVAPAEDRWRRRTVELRDAIAPDAALDLARWGTWGRRESITQAVERIHQEFLPGRRHFLFVNRVRANLIPAPQAPDARIRIAAVDARPAGAPALHEFLTLTNPAATAIDISDWRLDGPVRFQFKPGTVLAARSAAHVSPDRRAFRTRTTSPRRGERQLVLGDYAGELSAHGGTVVLRDPAGRVVDQHTFPGTPSPAQQFLRITELMVHPAGPGDAEFIELRNLGPLDLDLAGVRFTRGVTFDFSTAALRILHPGQSVLVVRDADAFRTAYGGDLPVAGVYAGSLDNAGERIRLEDAHGEVILDFIYPASTFPVADGLGFSLAVSDPSAPWPAWNDAGQWRPGAQPGGSPGTADAPLPAPPIQISEILTHTDPPLKDAIELHNPAPVPVSIAGWWLTDDPGDPRKFQIPAGTVLPPGGYLVFEETQFNPVPGAPSSFSLSSHGEQVWLFGAQTDGTLSGYSDGVVFPAAANGVSFGRHTNSAGQVLFPAQHRLSLGQPNAGPALGPVVIHEIHFAPARGDTPFIELKNLTASPVPLFHPDDPALTWRLRGVDFEFPPGYVLSPGGIVVIVGGDPADFRRHAAVLADVLGPWAGTLQRDGERLVLERPDTPDRLADGSVVIPRIAVDAVQYRAEAPWPVTPHTHVGSSLERRTPARFGEDPASWRASSGPPTPGTEAGLNRAPVVSAGAGQNLLASVFPLQVTLSGSATDDGLPEGHGHLALAWSQVAGPGVAEFLDPSAATTTVHLPGPGTFTLRLTAFDGDTSGFAEIVLGVLRAGSQPTLVPAGAAWRYFDLGREPGAGWRSLEFDDRTWPEGEAQLGFGDGDERHTLRSSAGGDRLLTAYFRRTFVVPDASAVRELTLRLLRDDGAAVWLNGVEALRSNLPEGTLGYATTALQVVGGTDESLFIEQSLAPGLLQSGTNLLAVEVHQQSASSSDLSFDLELVGLAQSVNRAPTVDAGPDLAVLPQQPVRLAATWQDDGLPQPAALRWIQLSGPAAAALAGANLAAPTLTLPLPGDYIFELTVSDGALEARDRVRLTAVPAENEYLLWKRLHFTETELANPALAGDDADPDGDGQSNLGEFHSGTDPRDRASVLRLNVEWGPDSRMRLVLHGVRGRSYAVQWRERIERGAWQTLDVLPPFPEDRRAEILDPDPPAGHPPRFYRVLVQPPQPR